MNPCNFVILFIYSCVWCSAYSSAHAVKKTEQASTDAASADVVADSTSADAAAANAEVSENEKLGTKWGDDVTSNVTEVDLKRLTDEPIAQASVRYASKQYQGKSVNSVSIASGVISFSVVDDADKPLPLVREGKNYFLKAKDGQSYQLTYTNHSNKTFEIVASVDGLDVLNGKEATKYASGYVLHPKQTLTIEGFRKSDSAVASFTFGKPDESYAANSTHGSIDNTGIIGTVVYEIESLDSKAVDADDGKYAPAPKAFPADH